MREKDVIYSDYLHKMISQHLNRICGRLTTRQYIMHPEDLNNIWICSNCQTAFVFRSDIMDHMNKTRHKHIKKFDLNTGRLIEVRAMV
jgi:hypothetical protein